MNARCFLLVVLKLHGAGSSFPLQSSQRVMVVSFISRHRNQVFDVVPIHDRYNEIPEREPGFMYKSIIKDRIEEMNLVNKNYFNH